MGGILLAVNRLLLLLSLFASVTAASGDVAANAPGSSDIDQQISTFDTYASFPPPSLLGAVKKATEVRFYQRDKDYHWKIRPFAVLNEQSHPHMFHLMKASPCHQGAGFSRIAMCEAAFIDNGKIISVVGYYANIGWLTEPQQQNGRVPEELRKWLYGLTSVPISMGQA